MRSPSYRPALAGLLLLAVSGCSYVHLGPASLKDENNTLRTEKELLQQQLALAQKEGATLRAMIDSPVPVGATSDELVTRLNATTRELAQLRVNYERLQSERAASPATAGETNAKLRDTEDRLATSLRAYTSMQDELGRIRTQLDKVQAENATLATQVRTLTAENQQAQATLTSLNTELLAQREARNRAEQASESLRTQLSTANDRIATLSGARAASAGGARDLSTSSLQTALNASTPPPTARLEADVAQVRGAGAPTRPGAVPPAAAPAGAPAAPAVRSHTVVAGDTLSGISRRYYGTADRWQEILNANRDVLKDDRSLVIGRTIKIP
jgi:LysM repeat protein